MSFWSIMWNGQILHEIWYVVFGILYLAFVSVWRMLSVLVVFWWCGREQLCGSWRIGTASCERLLPKAAWSVKWLAMNWPTGEWFLAQTRIFVFPPPPELLRGLSCLLSCERWDPFPAAIMWVVAWPKTGSAAKVDKPWNFSSIPRRWHGMIFKPGATTPLYLLTTLYYYRQVNRIITVVSGMVYSGEFREELW